MIIITPEQMSFDYIDKRRFLTNRVEEYSRGTSRQGSVGGGTPFYSREGGFTAIIPIFAGDQPGSGARSTRGGTSFTGVINDVKII